MEGWLDGGMEGWLDGGMEGWLDGGMEGWRDGGMDEMEMEAPPSHLLASQRQWGD